MILLCPPEKSMQFHYPLDPKKIRTEGSVHKDTTHQGSDRQDFYRHGKEKKKKKKKKNKTNKLNTDLDWVCHTGNPVIKSGKPRDLREVPYLRARMHIFEVFWSAARSIAALVAR